MGTCCSCCRQGSEDYEEIKGSAKEEGEEAGGGGGGGGGDVQKSDSVSAWDAEFLESKTSGWSFVTHCAVFAFPSGKLRAARPSGFTPNQTGVNDIIAALQGDSAGLEERSVALGGQTPVCTPGKIDDGKAIYCSSSTGEGGGCIAIRTNESLLVVFYNENADAAFTLTTEMAEYMMDNGR